MARKHSSRMRTGYFPTVSVVSHVRGWVGPPHGHTHLPPRRDMGPEIPTPRKAMETEISTSCGQTDTCENTNFPQLRWRVVTSSPSRGTDPGPVKLARSMK